MGSTLMSTPSAPRWHGTKAEEVGRYSSSFDGPALELDPLWPTFHHKNEREMTYLGQSCFFHFTGLRVVSATLTAHCPAIVTCYSKVHFKGDNFHFSWQQTSSTCSCRVYRHRLMWMTSVERPNFIYPDNNCLHENEHQLRKSMKWRQRPWLRQQLPSIRSLP